MNADDEESAPGTERWVEALTWHETLSGTDGASPTVELIREWRAWYANAENRRTFEHVTRLVTDVRFLAYGHHLSIPVEVSKSRRVLPAAPIWPLSIATKRPWRLAGVVAVVMAAIAVLIPLVAGRWIRIGHLHHSVTYLSGVGELRHERLGDGSEITLGGRTELVVTLSRSTRSVDLIRGEAWFRVAHDPNWPFVVHAGDGTVRDVGTAFLVRRYSDRVVVTVTEGTVIVSASPPASLSSIVIGEMSSKLPPPSIRIVSGQRIMYRDNGASASVSRVDANAAGAWIHGRLIFDDEPLRYVIEDVNRYSERNISATASAGNLRFSGVILDGEIEEWLQGLPKIFAVDVDQGSGRVCIHMRSTQHRPRCDATR